MWTPWILLGTATLLVARYEALIDGVTPQQVLDLLNSVRASVVPTAAQMVALTWDAKLASVAASYATTQCSGHMGGGGPSCPDCMNWMGDAENPSYGTHGILDAITGVFLPERATWSCTKTDATLTCTCSKGSCYGDWNAIVNDGATAVGCGEQSASACNGQFDIYICIFNGWTSNAHPYTPSATNASCTQGTCPTSYPFCVNGLCTSSPPPTSQMPPTTRRSPPVKRDQTTTHSAPRIQQKAIPFTRVDRTTSSRVSKAVPTSKRQTQRRSTRTRLTTTPRTPLAAAGYARTPSVHRPSPSKMGSTHAVVATRFPSDSIRPGSRFPSASIRPRSRFPSASIRPRMTGQVERRSQTLIRPTSWLNRLKPSIKGSAAAQGGAPASQLSILASVSVTAVVVLGTIALTCMAGIAICIRKSKQHVLQAPAVDLQYPSDKWQTGVVSAPPPSGSPLFGTQSVPVVPAAVPPSTSASEPERGRGPLPIPKSIRRLQARGVARDKFNQGAMTSSTSDCGSLYGASI